MSPSLFTTSTCGPGLCSVKPRGNRKKSKYWLWRLFGSKLFKTPSPVVWGNKLFWKLALTFAGCFFPLKVNFSASKETSAHPKSDRLQKDSYFFKRMYKCENVCLSLFHINYKQIIFWVESNIILIKKNYCHWIILWVCFNSPGTVGCYFRVISAAAGSHPGGISSVGRKTGST